MNTGAKHETTGAENITPKCAEVPFSITGDNEIKELYEHLCESLKDVIPEKFYPTFMGIRPIEAAIEILMIYGGRIRLNNPEIDLTGCYNIPEKTKELEDVIGSFKFWIPPSPFIALVAAARGDINADEEILQSRDREDVVPLIIENDGEVKRICLVNMKERVLEITLELGLQLDISLTGDESERKETTAAALRSLGEYLDKTKEEASKGPKLFDSPEEAEAVTAWCEKHSCKPVFLFRASIDCWS